MGRCLLHRRVAQHHPLICSFRSACRFFGHLADTAEQLVGLLYGQERFLGASAVRMGLFRGFPISRIERFLVARPDHPQRLRGGRNAWVLRLVFVMLVTDMLQ